MHKLREWLNDWGMFATLLLLTASLFTMTSYTLNTNTKLSRAASTAHQFSCKATKESNDALVLFFTQEVAKQPVAIKNKSLVELGKLENAYSTAELQCLTGGN